jgi:hypothetical protein
MRATFPSCIALVKVKILDEGDQLLHRLINYPHVELERKYYNNHVAFGKPPQITFRAAGVCL